MHEIIISVRDILASQTSELFFKLPDHFGLKFDDNSILNVTKRETIYSSYFWDIFRAYPNIVITPLHHVSTILKGKPLSSSTHTSLLTNIIKSVINEYNLHIPEQKEDLLAMVYNVTNRAYNELIKVTEEYVSSIDILDFIEIVDHEEVKILNNNTQANYESIANAYEYIREIINNNTDLSNNRIVKSVKSNMVNANQLFQCIASRGFLTEIDGSILPTPVLGNFTKGLTSLYNYVAESRSAAKALYFSEAPLQEAEYFARRLQLLSMVVERISYTDCGSTDYVDWRITPPLKDDKGNIIYKGDLFFMGGKNYVDETTPLGQYKQITGDDPTLYNKVLKLRSPLLCKHPNPHEICAVCFGGLAENVSKYANIGHLCSATMTQQTSQSVLSTKHLDASSTSSSITLDDVSKKFFVINKAKNAYIFKKDYKGQDIKIIVNRDEAIGLTDIHNTNSIDNINPTRISSITCIDIVHVINNEEITYPIFIGQENRTAIFSSEFLRYLLVAKWRTDDRNNFVFTLDKWNFNLPIFKLPDMEYSYSDHSRHISKIIESNMKSITDRMKPHSPISTLQELFSLVNTKLNVNIVALEVIIYANMIASKSSYSLSRNKPNSVLGVSKLIIKNRSLSTEYAYESQVGTLINPTSFYKLDRPDSIFDVFMCPDEVVKQYK